MFKSLDVVFLFPSTLDTRPVRLKAAVAENQPLRGKRIKQNRVSFTKSFDEFDSRLREFIAHPDPDDRGFNQLALELFSLQYDHVEPYRRLCDARRISPVRLARWMEIPPVPTAAFKEFELSSIPSAERMTVFHSSGTTGQQPSRHFHSAESLSLYESSLLPWFRKHILPDRDRFQLISLTPPPGLAPRSSLVHMLGAVQREFGSAQSRFTGTIDATAAWSLDLGATRAAFRSAIDREQPVAVLGTAFSFVHLLSWLALSEVCLQLPPNSSAMETGGYKGRSRQLPKFELHASITRHLAIPASRIVSEYGMSELSSQAYDHVIGADTPSVQPFNPSTLQRIFRFPPWSRARIVSPETGNEVAEGETGLIRVYDLANVRSVMAVQTEDLGVRRGDGFELIGRAAQAEPRGCSLMSL